MIVCGNCNSMFCSHSFITKMYQEKKKNLRLHKYCIYSEWKFCHYMSLQLFVWTQTITVHITTKHVQYFSSCYVMVNTHWTLAETCVPRKDFPLGNPHVEEAQCAQVPECYLSFSVLTVAQLTVCIEKVLLQLSCVSCLLYW